MFLFVVVCVASVGVAPKQLRDREWSRNDASGV